MALAVMIWLLLMLSSQQIVCGMVTRGSVCHGTSAPRRGLVQQAWRSAVACPAVCATQSENSWLRRPGRRGGRLAEVEQESPPVDFASNLFAFVNVGTFAFLLAHRAGFTGPIHLRASGAWKVFPASQCYLLLAHLGLGPWVGSSCAAFEDEENTGMAWTALTAFSMLLLQAAMIVAVCRAGPKAALTYLMYFPASICLCAWTYYARLVYGLPHVIPADCTGIQMYPEHHVMWMSSTVIQTLLWTHMHKLEVARELDCPLPSTPLLLTMVMMWSGIFGLLDYGECGSLTHTPNTVLVLVCLASFYALLLTSTRPLQLCAADYKARNLPVTHSLFKWAVRYIWLTWHGFPLVWALSALGLMGSSQREFLFMVCDLAAKFLPVTFFLNSVSLPL